MGNRYIKGILQNRIPEIGETFNHWKVLDNIPIDIGNSLYTIKCRCRCKKVKQVNLSKLINNKVISCGCHAKNRNRNLASFVGDLGDTYFNRVKRSAGLRNLEFDLDKEYLWNLFLVQNSRCALSGLELKILRSDVWSKKDFITASLDRIDNSKGYIKGNVQWLHKDINRMKNKFEEKYFISICKKIGEYNG